MVHGLWLLGWAKSDGVVNKFQFFMVSSRTEYPEEKGQSAKVNLCLITQMYTFVCLELAIVREQIFPWQLNYMDAQFFLWEQLYNSCKNRHN